ncbi:LysR family transcriptional regulator [Rhodoferax saidenbachensis]|uniref:DNA-binding transcriptional LysR family regulator n=1 Tax=Rhodoferax saidenbachensis TaxID=1484693 RepID=A0ABU1ZTW5_9BURK|nr:LysR family transcriptional regulator [Rhodoferax saidenbachensis]MDR7308853.1 DNA-binding transcriptional LysR family regulator [Rhodoferax saidenbachensis]
MIENLQAFIDVARYGTFSATAKARGVAVSSVSRQIDTLEASLGVRLFQRSSRRLLLTDAGELFLPRATDIAAELEDARAALLDAQAEPKGLLTVSVPAAFGRQHVTPVITSFLAKYPAIDLDLHLSDQWIDLSTQRADVAIRIGALPDSDLVATKLAPIRRLACASPDYLRRHGHPVVPEDLLQHSCLTVSSARVPTGWWSFPGVNQGHALAVKGRFKSDDTASLLQAGVAGLGVVHLASWLVYDQLASGALVQLFPPDDASGAKAVSAIHAVRLKGRSHAAKAQLFIDHLKSAIGSPPYWDREMLSKEKLFAQ